MLDFFLMHATHTRPVSYLSYHDIQNRVLCCSRRAKSRDDIALQLETSEFGVVLAGVTRECSPVRISCTESECCNVESNQVMSFFSQKNHKKKEK